jgi:Tol biopolymer transport system component
MEAGMMDRTSRTAWLVGVAIAAALVGGDTARAQRVSAADIRLREALHKEQVEGSLAEAIALYERIAADKQAPRAVAAQALLNLGRCHEKLGSRDAQRAYERIVQQFADQGSITAEARSRLAALRPPTTPRTGAITSSKLASAAVLYSANVSADGRFVVASTDDGFGVFDLTTGALTRLPDDPDRLRNRQRVISPDGKQVGYTGSVNGDQDFRVTNVDGSGVRIAQFRADYVGFSAMDWSRDGRVVGGLMFKRPPAPLAPRPLPSIATFDVTGGRFNAVDDALAGLDSPGAFLTALRLSPDGNFVAFVVRRPTNSDAAPGEAPNEAGDLYTMRVDGRDRQRLDLGDAPVELVAWLPDGQGIAFVSERTGVRTMFGIPIQSGTPTGPAVTLFRGVSRNRPLGMGPAGALTYAIDGRVLKSYVVDTSTNPPVRTAVSVSDREWEMFPRWSPDGLHLAFIVAPPFPRDDEDLRLVIRDVTSGEDRAVLRWQGSAAGGGAWTADGTGYVLSRRIGPPTFGFGGFQIDRVDVATGAVESVVPRQEAPVALPRLTPNGRHLYFVADRSRLVRVELETNERAELASIANAYDLSRDGSHVAYVQTESSSPVLKVQPVDGGSSRIVRKFEREDSIQSIAFSADGAWVVVSNARTWPAELFRVPMSGESNPVGLGVFVSSTPDIAVHPDGRRLAFIDNEWTVDFWQMRGLVDAFRTLTSGPPSGRSQLEAAPGTSR